MKQVEPDGKSVLLTSLKASVQENNY